MTVSTKRTRERGAVMLAAVIALIIVTMLSAALFSSALAQLKLSTTAERAAFAGAPAEGALELAEERLLESVATLLAGSGVPELPTDITGNVAYTIDLDPEVDTDEPQVVNVNYTISDDFDLDGWAAADLPQNAGHWEADADGVQTFYRNYFLWADATTVGIPRRSFRIIEGGLTPLFQYAVFYDGDLEILPGPSMTLSGRVHSNSNIYAGVGAGSTLTINSDYFRCAGSMFRQRKDTGVASEGILNVKVKGKSQFFQMLSKAQMSGLGFNTVSGFDSLWNGYDGNGDGDLGDAGDYPDFVTGATTLWEGSVLTEAHGVKRHEPPDYGNLKMYQKKASSNEWGDYDYNPLTKKWFPADPPGSGQYNKGNYYKNAALIIEQDPLLPNVWTVKDGSGNTIVPPVGTITHKTMYDAREGKTIKVVDVDMALLTKDKDVNGNGRISASEGDYIGRTGLVYVGRRDCVDPVSGIVGAPNGVRLINASRLYGADPLLAYDDIVNKDRKGATTVVSEDPLYVKGDYNTGGADPTKKVPAALIADAVNLLSKDWEKNATWSGDGKKDKNELPKAAATTYNAAMITGADSTVGSTYNGGFENLPRFHEDWSNVNCKIRGSFVNIFKSEIAKGKWVYGGDKYTAPNRDWDYDQSFNDLSKLPPYTPMAAGIRTAITITTPPPGWPPTP